MGKSFEVITENLDIWSSAIRNKSAAGRGTSKKIELYGIKKLRELILDLAVRGLLVPQDPNDEPAIDLLMRVQAEKTRLGHVQRIKTQNLIEQLPIKNPFNLPTAWKWEQLGNLGICSTGKTPSTKIEDYFEGVIPFIGPGEITSSSKFLPSDKKISEEGLQHSTEANSGDILMVCIGGSIGKSIICDKRIAFNQQINAVRPIFINSKFLNYAISSNYFLKSVLENATGSATPIINRSRWERLFVPIPPLEEQHRIVTKVDELMSLCDQLEQQQESSIKAHETLVQTLLTALTNAGEKGDFDSAWSRISENFDLLFVTDDSIDKLKAAILKLAIMGKLGPQASGDEAASEIIHKIAAHKTKLVREGKFKKPNVFKQIDDCEKPFKLPRGWAWARLGEVLDVRDGTHDSPKDADGDNTYPLVTSKDFFCGEINFEGARRISHKDYLEISKRSLVEVDDILFSMIGGNIGNQVIVKQDLQFSIKNVALFKHYDKQLILPKFIKLFTEELALGLQVKASGGAQPFVSLGFLRNLPLALPPVEEQKRIISRTNELMRICDILKSQIIVGQETGLQFADTVVQIASAVCGDRPYQSFFLVDA